MRPIIIFIVLCLIGKSIQRMGLEEYQTASINQFSCVKTALKQYIRYYERIVIFSKHQSNIQNSLPKVPLYFATEWHMLRNKIFADVRAMIIFLERNVDQDFNDLKHLQSVAMVQPVLVVCIIDVNCGSEMYLKKITEMVDIVHLHYIAMGESGIIDIYEYTTTVEGSCGTGQLLKLGKCSYSDRSVAEKLFRLSVNFHKCPLRLINWSTPPYSILCEYNKSTDLCGMEGKIVQVLAEKLNATPALMTAKTPRDVRQIVENRQADLGFGKLDIHSYEGVSYSRPYFFIEATVIARHSTWTSKESIKDILLPFEFEVWVGIGVSIFSIFVLRFLIPYFRTTHTLHMFGMLMGIVAPVKPQRLPSRIYFISLVLFAYFCSQAYLANLTKVFSTPSEQLIKTLDDLENSKLRVTGTTEARERFKDDYPKIYRNFQLQDYSDYYTKLFELVEGRITSVLYVEEIVENIAEWKKVAAVQNRISWYPVGLVVPNSSAILRTTNKFLGLIIESGFVSLYEFFLSEHYRSAKYQENFASRSSNKLELYELEDVFMILLVGWAMSVFVFLIELITAFTRNKRPQFKRWRETHLRWSRERRFHGTPCLRRTSRGRRH